MKSLLKATAVLSSASVVGLLAGLLSSKVNAVLLGPAGVGYMGLLQGLVGLAAMIASMGVGAGVIRTGAQALAADDVAAVVALRRGAWLLCWTLGGFALVLLVALRAPLSRLMLGGAEHTGAVVLMGAALLLALAAGVQTSVLNAYRRTGDLARGSVCTSLLGVALSLLVVWRWRARGIAAAVLVTYFVNWAVSYYFMRGRVPAVRAAHVRRDEVFAAARALFTFGAPFTASLLVGAGVQLLVPVLVLHARGATDVGYYRAASAVAINYLGFLLAAMAQDYYPRVSAAGREPQALGRLVNEQLRLVLVIAGPVILGMIALVPYLVPLIYTRQFTPAVSLLEWQLVGDLFKFASWTMAFVILARSGSVAYFLTELAGGSAMLLASWQGMRWFGLEGLGASFLLANFFYFCVCLFVLRRDIDLRWTKGNKLLFLALVLTTLCVRALPFLGLAPWRTPLALACAGLFGALSLRAIWGEVGGLRGLSAWRRRAA